MIIRRGIKTSSGQFHVFAIGTDSEPVVVERPTPDGPKFSVVLANRILEEETLEKVRPYLQASTPDGTGSIGNVVASGGPEPKLAVAPATLDLAADLGEEALEEKRPRRQKKESDVGESHGGNGNGHKSCGGTRRQIQDVAIAAALAEA